MTELGGVPILIKAGDMSNTIPDEKVTATFVGYLAARLLDLSREIKAARIIQVTIKVVASCFFLCLPFLACLEEDCCYQEGGKTEGEIQDLHKACHFAKCNVNPFQHCCPAFCSFLNLSIPRAIIRANS